MIDYHIHPDFSIDAEEYSITDYCDRALQLDLKEICFTPHFEFDPTRKELDWFVRVGGKIISMQSDWLEEYFKLIQAARARYKSLGLTVKGGIEIGYDLGLEKEIAKVVENYPFDFVLGSIHCVDHVAISSATESKNYYPGKSLQEVCSKYFATLLEGVKSGLFDVVGHMDIYRRHGTRFYGAQVDFIHQELVEPILLEMSQRGIGLEINTSSLGSGQAEFYPNRDIVERAKNTGVSVFTVGSDAHRLQDLGRGVNAALQLLYDVGLSPSSFSRRKPSSID